MCVKLQRRRRGRVGDADDRSAALIPPAACGGRRFEYLALNSTALVSLRPRAPGPAPPARQRWRCDLQRIRVLLRSSPGVSRCLDLRPAPLVVLQRMRDPAGGGCPPRSWPRSGRRGRRLAAAPGAADRAASPVPRRATSPPPSSSGRVTTPATSACSRSLRPGLRGGRAGAAGRAPAAARLAERRAGRARATAGDGRAGGGRSGGRGAGRGAAGCGAGRTSAPSTSACPLSRWGGWAADVAKSGAIADGLRRGWRRAVPRR